MLTRVPEPLDGILTVTPGGTEQRHAAEGRYVLVKDRAASLQTRLLLLGDVDASGPLAAVIPLDDETLGRIEALIRYWRATHGRQVPADTRLTVQQRRRFRLMMRTVDGRINRASYREIAEILFGHDRISAEYWKTSSLRKSVSELAQDGFALIAGGYRRLLHHRRRL